MTDRPWYKRYPSDALNGMVGLTLEQKGAYNVVLDLIYDRDGPIPDEERWLAGHCGCSVRKWKSIRDTLLALGKIELIDGLIDQKRARKERENARKTREKLAENGSKGGRKRAENADEALKTNDNFEAGLKHRARDQKPEARSQIPDKTPPVVPPKGDERQAELIPSEKTDDEPTRTRSRTRLPQDWRHLNEPPNDQHRHALQQGLSDTTAVREWQKFVNHHVAKGSTMANWPAAWRTWVDNVPSFNRGARDGRKQTGHETFERVARRIYERETAAERGAGEPDGGPLDAGPGDGGGTDRQAWVALSAPARERES